MQSMVEGALLERRGLSPSVSFAATSPAGGGGQASPCLSLGVGQSPLPAPQRQITHIRVGFAFPAEIANLAMARHKVDVIAIRPELAGDGGD